jgi:hypothetical protein
MGFDFDAAVTVPFRMQPGLRRLADGALQLTPSVTPIRDRARHLNEKLAVLRAFAAEALCATPAFDPGPAIDALAAQAAAEHPEVWAVDAAGCHARALGWAVAPDASPVDEGGVWPEVGACLAALAPAWRRSALLALAFVEDFAIVDAASGCVPWIAAALPSAWSPRAKVGRRFAAIHAPVADNRLLLAAGDALLRMVCAEPRWERFVWTVTPHPRLHALPAHLDPAGWQHALDAAALPALAWFRTERQTFIPVPDAAQAVFTIAVQVQPLEQAVDSPRRARRLHDAIASMSPAVIAYRGLAPVREPLLRWLAARAQA